MKPSWILRSTRVAAPAGIIAADVLVRDGRIVDLYPHGKAPGSHAVEDAGDAVVMPGLVDTHVHVNEPGRTEWEGFATATQAAAVGGITSLLDMPLNSTPVTTTVAALARKRQAAEGKLWVNCGFLGGLVPGHENDVPALIAAGVRGIKAFLVHSGIDDFPNATEKELRATMPVLARHQVALQVHAEVDTLHPGGRMTDGRSYRQYLASRPRTWERDAIELMLRLCREYGTHIHIVHLASADELDLLAAARREGLPVTVETCPHYLFFAAEDVPDGDTRYKCAPPIRERENRERLWEGLRSGVIDNIVSDHSPCPPSMKNLALGDFSKAWGGISSLQFGLSVVWTAARERGFGLANLVRWMSAGPAALAGWSASKGRLAAGYDADLVVWRPEAAFTVRRDSIYHRHKLTPYEGQRLYGVVERTYVGGHKVAEQGVALAEPRGRLMGE